MRILSVSPYWAPEGGGLERYAREIAVRLAQRGHDVRAIAFARVAPPGAFEDTGVPVDLVEADFRISNTPLARGFRRRIEDAIDAFEPDVVVAHGPVPFPLEMAALACRGRDVAFVPVVHAGALEGGNLALNALARLDRATLFAHACRRANRIVAVSAFVRDGILAKHARKTHVVAPGVDLDRFRIGPPADASTVAFVGPLDAAYAWKGFDFLWDAVRIAGVRLLVVGDGDRRARWERRAKLDSVDVEFLGRVDEPALVRAYHAAGAVVLPSISDAESFGMVLAEGNACGRPAVGTRVGGIPGFVRDGDNGLLVPPGDAAALGQALAQLADDPILARRLGARGRRLVEAEHGWAGITARFEAALLDATGFAVTTTSEAAPQEAVP